jgi:hypothetical protein
MLTVYSEHITPRLEYICDLLFQDMVGIDIMLSSDRDSLNPAHACINYSNEEIEGVPFIRPHGLLSNSEVRTTPQFVVDEQGHFFHADSNLFDFDVLAASFYLVSRHEEYTAAPAAFDEHGRFRAEESLAGKHKLLHRPLVDQWALELRTKLLTLYPTVSYTQRTYRFLSTYDIDVAFAYGNRGFLREVGSQFKDLISLKWKRFRERRKVLKGELKDPYDSYEQQQHDLTAHGIDSKHFFLLGDYGDLDKNISHKKEVMTALIKKVSSFSSVGIHPSMGSQKSKRKVSKEIKRLAKITGSPVTLSRQHFLSFKLPHSFQELADLGIKEDYSMAYAEALGFRASTCTPHQFFDLEKNKASDLLLVPTCVMDSTLKDYLNLQPEAAKKEVTGLISSVKKVSGTFVSLWHNHSITDYGEWTGWKEVYTDILDKAS